MLDHSSQATDASDSVPTAGHKSQHFPQFVFSQFLFFKTSVFVRQDQKLSEELLLLCIFPFALFSVLYSIRVD